MSKYYYDKESLPNKFYLFSYGANNIKQLSKTLRYNDNIEDNLKLSCIGLKIFGYHRDFFGNSKRWQGAIATISPKKFNCVDGICLLIEKQNNNYKNNNILVNFDNLLNREEFPSTYILEKISNDQEPITPSQSDNNIPIIAFVVNPTYVPKTNAIVNEKYLTAILKTLIDYRYLKIQNNKLFRKYYLPYDRNNIFSKYLNKPYCIEINYVNNIFPSITHKFVIKDL